MGKIFISYARADDELFVKQLSQDLTESGFDIWWDRTAMESRGLIFLQEIRGAIRVSDQLIAVIGPNAVKSEYVKVEWEHALLFSKGLVPILRGGLLSQDIIDYDIVPPELSKFHCPAFRKERLYQDALAELIRVLEEPVPPPGAFRTAVPSLPPHFLPCLDELVLLRNAVLVDIKRLEVITCARQKTIIVGMGGMGKSVLAATFARSTETCRAFTDGVAWISIGQTPDMLSNLRQVQLALNDKMENYVDLKTARDKLPGVLSDKVCLIVLDDVRNVDHAQPFINALGPRCRLLITTRDEGIDMKNLLDKIRQWKDVAWLCSINHNLTPPGGPLIRTLEGHTSSVTAVSVLPDGKRAISGSYDNTLKVWDLESRVAIASFSGDGPLHNIAVSWDGKTIIAGGESGRVHILASKEPTNAPHPHSPNLHLVHLQRY